MSKIPHASWLVIPAWLDSAAPGAADAARMISNGKMSKQQRERLQDLVNETKPAWGKLPKQRRGSREQLSPEERHAAQHELMTTAFYAADFVPIGKPEIEKSKNRLKKNAMNATTLSLDLSQDARDAQLNGFWGAYRNNRRGNALLQQLPNNLVDVAKVVEFIGDFYSHAAPLYKPQGPVPPVGRPSKKDAKQTTFRIKLEQVCEKHFDTPLYFIIDTLTDVAFPNSEPVSAYASLRKSRARRRGAIHK